MADKISEKELNQLAARGKATVRRKVSRPPTASEIAAAEPEPAPPPPPQPAPPVDVSLPFASMQASFGAMNQMLAEVVESNTRAIAEFKREMQEKKPVPGMAYRHVVKRDRNKLIEYVDSIPLKNT